MRLEDKASKAAYKIMQRPVDDNVGTGQLTLPFRFRETARATSKLEEHATYLSAVAVTEQAMHRPNF